MFKLRPYTNTGLWRLAILITCHERLRLGLDSGARPSLARSLARGYSYTVTELSDGSIISTPTCMLALI